MFFCSILLLIGSLNNKNKTAFEVLDKKEGSEICVYFIIFFGLQANINLLKIKIYRRNQIMSSTFKLSTKNQNTMLSFLALNFRWRFQAS
jgi:hypothetical protein